MRLGGRHRADSTRLGVRFNILWVGQAVSYLGDYMAYISIPLFVALLAREGRSLEFGITYALDSAPTLALGLVGGIILDRLRLRPVMIVADLGRAAAFGFLAWVAAGDPQPGTGQGLAVVFTVAFIVGSFTSLFQSGLFTLIPSLVSKRDLALANGRVTAAQNLSVALGPFIAGVLISASDSFALVFAADAATFLVSAASIVLIGPIDRPPLDDPPAGLRADIMNGLRYLWNESRLKVSTIALAAGNFMFGFLEATFVLAAANEQLVGASEGWQQGVLFAMFGLGGVAGSVVAPAFTRFLGLGRTMIVGFVVFGLAYTVFVHTPFGPAGLLYLFLALAGLQFVNVPAATIRQVYTPPAVLGRVMAASRALAWSSLPVGALAGTWLVDAIGEVADGRSSFVIAVRVAPLAILAVGVALLPTVIWRDTFGPPRGRRMPTTSTDQR